MFFRMLKKDFLSRKGLNIILLIFIITSSVLVFASSALIYTGLTGWSNAREKYNLTDLFVSVVIPEAKREERNNMIEDYLESDENYGDHYYMECLSLGMDYIDISDFCRDKDMDDLPAFQCLTRQPREATLVYDINDRPFYVKNGEIAVPKMMMSSFGAKEGDKIRITDKLGEIYEFTISHFYKDPNIYPFRLIVSDSDYDTLSTKHFVKRDCYYVNYSPISQKSDEPLFRELSKNIIYFIIFDNDYNTSEDHIIADLVSAFTALMSGFMILLVFITIRFTVIAELHEQEKEIGIMRAVGVDSIRFRWLFCAKYIAFSVIGGISGVAVGFPCAELLCNRFYMNFPMPSAAALLTVGISAVISIIAGIILFSLFMMHKMKRISIMTAIHGETLGERFGSNRSPLLHKNKFLPLPLYLAVADILSKAKKYVFLALTYSLCVTIFLLAFYFRHSVVSNEFLKYALMDKADFDINLPEETEDIYLQRENYENISIYQQINEDLRNNNIPAHLETYNMEDASVITEDGFKLNVFVILDLRDSSFLQYAEGSAPVLKNEVAVSCHSALKYGLSVGDVINIEFTSIDQNEYITFDEQFVITGLFDMMEYEYPMIITSPDFVPYENYGINTSISSAVIESDNKEEVIEQMRKLYGEENVLDNKQYLNLYFEEFIPSLDLMMWTLSISVLIISSLITVLYLNIFLTEDRYDIALLKSLGFTDRAIIGWQLLRLVILSGAAMAAGIIITNTLGQKFAQLLTEAIVSLTGFRFVSVPVFTFLIMPAFMGMTVLLPAVVCLRKIHNTDFRNINEEM